MASLHQLPKDPYPVVCFDLDGTLLDGTIFIWKTLHEHFRTDPDRRRRAREDFFSGRIPYHQWFETDLELLSERGANRVQITEMLKKSVRPMRGALETLEALGRAGVKRAILSGGLDVVLWSFFRREVFSVVLLNKLYFSDEGLIAGGKATPYDLERKADGLFEIARRLGVEPEDCAFVGDNYNDLSAASVAGRSIAFCPKSEELRHRAHVTVDERDLRAVLPHLGR